MAYAFTEHGALTAANVLNSPQAMRCLPSEIFHLKSSEVWPAAPTGTAPSANWLPRPAKCRNNRPNQRQETMNRSSHTTDVAAAMAHSAIGNPHCAFLCAGDPEFKAVEKEIKIGWLK